MSSKEHGTTPSIHTTAASPRCSTRAQRWSDHFAWSDDGVTLVGQTPSGRATIALLRLNSDWIVQARRLWMRVGLQPPLD